MHEREEPKPPSEGRAASWEEQQPHGGGLNRPDPWLPQAQRGPPHSADSGLSNSCEPPLGNEHEDSADHPSAIPPEIEADIHVIADGDPDEIQRLRQQYFEDPVFRESLENPFDFSLTRPSPDFRRKSPVDEDPVDNELEAAIRRYAGGDSRTMRRLRQKCAEDPIFREFLLNPRRFRLTRTMPEAESPSDTSDEPEEPPQD